MVFESCHTGVTWVSDGQHRTLGLPNGYLVQWSQRFGYRELPNYELFQKQESQLSLKKKFFKNPKSA